MRISNAMIEQAEARVERERETRIAMAQASLRKEGTRFCIACAEEIEPNRRRALPSAKRCIECQLRVERMRRRRR